MMDFFLSNPSFTPSSLSGCEKALQEIGDFDHTPESIKQRMKAHLPFYHEKMAEIEQKSPPSSTPSKPSRRASIPSSNVSTPLESKKRKATKSPSTPQVSVSTPKPLLSPTAKKTPKNTSNSSSTSKNKRSKEDEDEDVKDQPAKKSHKANPVQDEDDLSNTTIDQSDYDIPQLDDSEQSEEEDLRYQYGHNTNKKTRSTPTTPTSSNGKSKAEPKQPVGTGDAVRANRIEKSVRNLMYQCGVPLEVALHAILVTSGRVGDAAKYLISKEKGPKCWFMSDSKQLEDEAADEDLMNRIDRQRGKGEVEKRIQWMQIE
eukprot:TRINITY_DN618_c0_g1_i2.p1 TRINITY_DN618_c0_g1~~TRINITY_DN618_c0_g1_i2.p1  ORF type:complete len:316 (-),score=127.43 TRINITY_DN618_c0_g1_i2:83-1030(-)